MIYEKSCIKYPEFCAEYKLANVSLKDKSYIFSDKLRICVVNLSRIDIATEQDKASGIELWARVFTATTWEEIDMLAQNNEYLQEVVSSVRQLTEEEKIRQQCEARETNAYWERIREAARMQELQDQEEAHKQELQNQEEIHKQELQNREEAHRQELQNQQEAHKQELRDIYSSGYQKLKNKVQSKIIKGKSLELIADELEEDVEALRPLYQELISELQK